MYNPFAFITDMFREIDVQGDERYRRESDWVDKFQTKDFEEETGKIVLEHALKKYDEALENRKSLDAKFSDLVKTAGTLVVLLFSAIKAFDIHPNWPLYVSLCSFLIAVVIGIASRRALLRGASPIIRHVLDGVPKAHNARAWLSAAYHRIDENLRVIENKSATRLNVATWFLCIGVTMLPLSFILPVC